MYFHGSNDLGTLGVGDTEVRNGPTTIPFFVKKNLCVQQIFAGGLHVFARTDDDSIYAWGSGKEGQLGLQEIIEKAVDPVLVPHLSKMKLKTISAGGGHNLAITSFDQVISWGFGKDGRLGHENQGNLNVPKPIESLKKKKSIAVSCGVDHALVVVEEDEDDEED